MTYARGHDFLPHEIDDMLGRDPDMYMLYDIYDEAPIDYPERDTGCGECGRCSYCLE